jgi:hypothetical protein
MICVERSQLVARSLHAALAYKACYPTVVERIKALLAEYGRVAMATYFGLFALVFIGFGVAIALGMDVASAEGGAGVLGAAYVATKLTQPLRIAATIAMTPLVARVARVAERFRKPRTESIKPLESHSPDTPPPSL